MGSRAQGLWHMSDWGGVGWGRQLRVLQWGSGMKGCGGRGAGALPPLDVLFYREQRDVSGGRGVERAQEAVAL